MRINNFYTPYSINKTVDFKGKVKLPSHINIQNTNFIKKKSSKIIPLLLVLGSFLTCKSTDTVNGVEDYNGVKIEYFDVKAETKDSVLLPLYKLKDKLNPNNDFLNNIKIDVVKSFGTMNVKDEFSNYLNKYSNASYIKGKSFYSDKNIQKRIAIQEKAHKNKPEIGISQVKSMQHSLMHEVGHQFDNYFGHDHNADFAKKWDSILLSKTNKKNISPYRFASKTSFEKQVDKEYNSQNGLSDKETFVQAYNKDLKIIEDIKKNNPKFLPKNISYYTEIKDGAEIENTLDMRRAEVYANMFSYIMGEDEGAKESFLNAFPNCYEIVKKDVAKYLSIQK